MTVNVTPDQFEVRDGLVIHKPTGAEFIPHPEREGSVMVWTGNIGRKLPDGAIYQYGDVLYAMKSFWWGGLTTARGPLAAQSDRHSPSVADKKKAPVFLPGPRPKVQEQVLSGVKTPPDCRHAFRSVFHHHF